MSLEEGLKLGLQEWGRTGASERLAFHEMAVRFLELEAQEEMQKLTWMKGMQSLSGSLSGCTPHSGLQAQAAPRKPHKSQSPPRHPVPLKTSLGAAQDMDVEGTPLPQPLDMDVLSLIDQLCSQEDFLTQPEALLNPQFLEELLSPDPELDLSTLAEELGQQGGLSPTQLPEQHSLDVNRRGGEQEPSGPTETPVDTGPSGGASQGPVLGPLRDEEPLPSLAFLMASPHSLLPPGFALSPEPATAHSNLYSGRPRAPRCAHLKRKNLPAAPAQEAKSRKRPLEKAPGQSGSTALPRGSAGLAEPSSPKRRCPPQLPGGAGGWLAANRG
ncbi:NUT family member 2G-like [Erinaceus europaeus]|uniref:NUT family member 2G-like n=1 Tax=Erinaceus europaeus TaxID=9365 RepID=A0ABM3X6J1_ERIEU|nr:NUT family member 2G-like [Erinaceus europaeus]